MKENRWSQNPEKNSPGEENQTKKEENQKRISSIIHREKLRNISSSCSIRGFVPFVSFSTKIQRESWQDSLRLAGSGSLKRISRRFSIREDQPTTSKNLLFARETCFFLRETCVRKYFSLLFSRFDKTVSLEKRCQAIFLPCWLERTLSSETALTTLGKSNEKWFFFCKKACFALRKKQVSPAKSK